MFFYRIGGGKKNYKYITVKTSSTSGSDATIDVTVDGKTTTYHHGALTSKAIEIADGFTLDYKSNWNVRSTDGSSFAYKIGSTIYVNSVMTWIYTTVMNATVCINSAETIHSIFD